MQQIVELLNINMIYIILVLMSLSFIHLITIMILFAKNKKLENKYNEFMRGTETDIEGLLRESIKKSTDVQESYKDIETSINQIEVQLRKCVQRVGVVRYSAVSGVGSDLSFTIAFLDQENDGVVVNGIYTRDGSYTYAKPVKTGKSKHTLSDEEKEAITIAMGN